MQFIRYRRFREEIPLYLLEILDVNRELNARYRPLDRPRVHLETVLQPLGRAFQLHRIRIERGIAAAFG